MIDPMEQAENDYQNEEVIAAARDQRVDDATEEDMKVLSAVELQSALYELDIEKVEGGTYKAGTVEEMFSDILDNIKYAANGHIEDKQLGKMVRDLVFKNHRDNEIDPIID